MTAIDWFYSYTAEDITNRLNIIAEHTNVSEPIRTFVIPPMSDAYILPLVKQYSTSLNDMSKELQVYRKSILLGNISILHLADQIISTITDIEFIINKITFEITFPIRKKMYQNMEEILIAYNRSHAHLLDLYKYFKPALAYAMPKLIWERPKPVFNGTWVSKRHKQ